MTTGILLAALVILVCVLLNRFTHRFGIPVLLAFIALGLVFGTDGVFKIHFENYGLVEKICSVALIFIMFFGGFGTNWKEAKPVAVQSALLATLGVALTALLTGLGCYLLLGIPLLESMLIGSVVSSTDAASVFSILRSKKLGLKNNTDSMLELESGSNDPCSYMLTIIMLSVMDTGVSGGSVVYLLFTQFAFGLAFGVVLGFGAVFFMRRFRFVTDGFDMAFITGVALLAYAAAAATGGNGYLSVYLCGIILGNQKIQNQKALNHFFSGVTGLVQMLIFFLLGLLATPSKIPAVFFTALAVMLVLTLVARPLAVFSILSPFRCSLRQQTLVSFAGLRGAASIVFAIMATVSPPNLANDLYHIVFCIVLLSITFQGTLLPLCAKKLKMTDGSIDVLKTFSDYSEELELHFIQVKMEVGHPWTGREIKAITLPPDTLIVMLLRAGARIVPGGNTQLQQGDIAILSARAFCDESGISLREHTVTPGSGWEGKTIQEFSKREDELVIVLIRGNKTILPKGDTEIKARDVLVIHGEA